MAISTARKWHAAVLTVALAAMSGTSLAAERGQQAAPPPIPDRTIALELPATTIAALGGSLVALGGEAGIIVLDVATGEHVDRIATDEPVVALQSLEGRNSQPALSATIGQSAGKATVVLYQRQLRGLQLSEKASIEMADRAVVNVPGGDLLARIDRSPGESAFMITQSKDGTRRIQTDAPLLLLLPTSSPRQVIAVHSRSVSLIDLEYGRVLDQITVSGYEAGDPGEIVGLVAHHLDGATGAGLVFDGQSESLTILQATVGSSPSVSQNARISVADKSLPMGRGMPFIAADDEFQSILVGSEGDSVLPMFRRVGLALERAGHVDLKVPLRVATVLPDSSATGPDAFAFLSQDGRSLILAPDLASYWAEPSQPRQSPLRSGTPIIKGGHHPCGPVRAGRPRLSGRCHRRHFRPRDGGRDAGLPVQQRSARDWCLGQGDGRGARGGGRRQVRRPRPRSRRQIGHHGHRLYYLPSIRRQHNERRDQRPNCGSPPRRLEGSERPRAA